MPGAGTSGHVVRCGDVAVVVHRHATACRGAREAGDLHRAPGIGLAPGRVAAGRIRGGENVAGLVARGAEQRREAVDRFQVAGTARSARRNPCAGAPGGVGRDEDPAFFGDGDAERGRAAGDAAEIERVAELRRLPLPRDRVRRRQDPACVGVVRPARDRGAKGGRRAGDRDQVSRAFLFLGVHVHSRPGAGSAGRIGGYEDPAVICGEGAEALRRAGDGLERPRGRFAVRFSFGAGLAGAHRVFELGHVPAAHAAGRALREGEGALPPTHGDAQRFGRTRDSRDPELHRAVFGIAQRWQLSQRPLRRPRRAGSGGDREEGDRRAGGDQPWNESPTHRSSASASRMRFVSSRDPPRGTGIGSHDSTGPSATAKRNS